MNILEQIEQLIQTDDLRKAQRLFEVYFAVYPQQAKQHISTFQTSGLWILPSIPQSPKEIEQKVRLLCQENNTLKAIEFYRLHTNCSLKESAQKVQRLCADIFTNNDE